MHIMLDLETMGTRANSAIVSIGAVAFDATGVSAEFIVNVDLQSNLDAGRSVSGATIQWWMQQSEEAQAAFRENPRSLGTALIMFARFCNTYGSEQIWGNGASFDNVLLSDAYQTAGYQVPWKFWNDRCYRTIKSIYRDVQMARSGTHHKALDDARSQAEHLIAINQKYPGIL